MGSAQKVVPGALRGYTPPLFLFESVGTRLMKNEHLLRLALGALFAITSACAGDDRPTPDEPGAVVCSDGSPGGLVCSAGEVCCGVAGEPNFCAESCDRGVTFACDGPEDCDGNACCFATSGSSVTCGDSPSCEAPGQPTCEVSSECPDDMPCCVSAEINDVRVRICGTFDGCS